MEVQIFQFWIFSILFLQIIVKGFIEIWLVVEKRWGNWFIYQMFCLLKVKIRYEIFEIGIWGDDLVD